MTPKAKRKYTPPNDWMRGQSTAALFKCLFKDLELLRSGDWIPNDYSVDCTIDVLKEIKRRTT
jgi:hypothetical protein